MAHARGAILFVARDHGCRRRITRRRKSKDCSQAAERRRKTRFSGRSSANSVWTRSWNRTTWPTPRRWRCAIFTRFATSPSASEWNGIRHTACLAEACVQARSAASCDFSWSTNTRIPTMRFLSRCFSRPFCSMPRNPSSHPMRSHSCFRSAGREGRPGIRNWGCSPAAAMGMSGGVPVTARTSSIWNTPARMA